LRTNAIITAVEEGIVDGAAVQKIVLDAVVAQVFEVDALDGLVRAPWVHADAIAAVKDPHVLEMKEQIHGPDIDPIKIVHRTPSSGGRLLS